MKVLWCFSFTCGSDVLVLKLLKWLESLNLDLLMREF